MALNKFMLGLAVFMLTFSVGCESNKLKQIPSVVSAFVSILETSPLPEDTKVQLKPYITIIQMRMANLTAASVADADMIVVLVEAIQDAINIVEKSSTDNNSKVQVRNYGLWAITLLKLVSIF